MGQTDSDSNMRAYQSACQGCCSRQANLLDVIEVDSLLDVESVPISKGAAIYL